MVRRPVEAGREPGPTEKTSDRRDELKRSRSGTTDPIQTDPIQTDALHWDGGLSHEAKNRMYRLE
jgi:hypothetical protein